MDLKNLMDLKNFMDLKSLMDFQNLMTPIFLLPGKTDLSKYFLNMFGQPQDQKGLSLVQDSVKTNIHIH